MTSIQHSYLQFLGISLGKDLQSFCNELKKKGFSENQAYSQVHNEGKFFEGLYFGAQSLIRIMFTENDFINQIHVLIDFNEKEKALHFIDEYVIKLNETYPQGKYINIDKHDISHQKIIWNNNEDLGSIVIYLDDENPENYLVVVLYFNLTDSEKDSLSKKNKIINNKDEEKNIKNNKVKLQSIVNQQETQYGKESLDDLKRKYIFDDCYRDAMTD